MQLAGINFQACSFNHSEFSPFRINHSQSQLNGENANCDTRSNVLQSRTGALGARKATTKYMRCTAVGPALLAGRQ